MSYKIYPVTETETKCDDYIVTVNGLPVPLNVARVSAVPFNRRWPGHQRQIDQSEVIQFLSLATDEPLRFEITPKTPFKEIKIRPKSLGIEPEITPDGKICFELDKPAYFTVEPYGRNRALHIFADPMPEYDVDMSDPNLLYFGKGEHDMGVLELKSGQTVFIDEGAVVYACIHAIDADNIKILGRGILDNSRNKEKILFEANVEDNNTAVKNVTRRHTVVLEYCNNIVIDGITIRDSLVYNIRPMACRNIRINNVKIIGCWRFNSDGIDMHNCVDVHIEKCFIRTFDDSICVKGFDCYYSGDIEAAVQKAMYRNGKSYDVFKNVLVEDCVIWNDWGKALEIGAETKAEEIHSISFRNCDIIHITGNALDCMNVDYADVHDILFTDINIEADEVIPKSLIQKKDDEVYVNTDPNFMPLTLCAEVIYHHEYSAGSATRRGRIRNIVFNNINVYSDKMPKAYFFGYDEDHKTENILVTNLRLNGEPITALSGQNWSIGKFTDNIRIEADPYAQLSKNTVDASEQLNESRLVKFDFPNGKGKRVMFVGNSITLHGIRPGIGWYGSWGMAASSRENDYVHLLESAVKKLDGDASFCICQVADWERSYKNGGEVFSLYGKARKFGADIIVLRFVENVNPREFDPDIFKSELKKLIEFLNGTGKAQLIFTTGFWRHPADAQIRTLAEELGAPCVALGDLGEDDSMKAISLFDHKGVANHPGDKGMEAIANRIFEVVKRYVP